MSCRCAKFDSDSFRYKCSVSGDGCMFMLPDEKLCYETYGEGPLDYENGEVGFDKGEDNGEKTVYRISQK